MDDETITQFVAVAFIAPLLVTQIIDFILNHRGVDFTEAVKQLHYKKIKKAKMIGRDVVIYIRDREGRGSYLVVEDSEGNSIDVSLSELINARWSIKEQSWISGVR